MIVLLSACGQQASENKILPISKKILIIVVRQWSGRSAVDRKFHSLQTDLYQCDPIFGAARLRFCVLVCCVQLMMVMVLCAATAAGISRIDIST
ncbi:hypothetical protein Q3G72_025824 [Acer saccharum]|nr:hypothetical protein Q3G72_025824 [Acer saccharum]